MPSRLNRFWVRIQFHLRGANICSRVSATFFGNTHCIPITSACSSALMASVNFLFTPTKVSPFRAGPALVTDLQPSRDHSSRSWGFFD